MRLSSGGLMTACILGPRRDQQTMGSSSQSLQGKDAGKVRAVCAAVTGMEAPVLRHCVWLQSPLMPSPPVIHHSADFLLGREYPDAKFWKHGSGGHVGARSAVIGRHVGGISGQHNYSYAWDM